MNVKAQGTVPVVGNLYLGKYLAVIVGQTVYGVVACAQIISVRRCGCSVFGNLLDEVGLTLLTQQFSRVWIAVYSKCPHAV